MNAYCVDCIAVDTGDGNGKDVVPKRVHVIEATAKNWL
jgi:isocitrate/isopropylmalate dehydrogenase